MLLYTIMCYNTLKAFEQIRIREIIKEMQIKCFFLFIICCSPSELSSLWGQDLCLGQFSLVAEHVAQTRAGAIKVFFLLPAATCFCHSPLHRAGRGPAVAFRLERAAGWERRSRAWAGPLRSAQNGA